jgi:prepilin-type N-terminal cleavage/methylation domain-containing protein
VLSRYSQDEQGLTLVELMLAMFLLSIILAATAGSLITFSRASVDNEHRVKATGVVTRLHEELQSRPWDDAVLYEDEIAPLSAIGVDTATATFEGEDLVTIPGPGCDVTDPDCRIETVPLASETIDVDGRDYEVLRAITWTEPDGVQPESVKRFTTVVRWQSLGRTLEERLDSTRAPVPGEVPVTATPSVQFLIAPQDVPLTLNSRNAGPISLTVDFTGIGYISGAKVLFRHAGLAAGDPATELTLAREGATDRFTGTIPANAYEWAEGSQTFTAVGQEGVNQVSTTAAVTFLPPGFIPDPTIAPVITQSTASSATITVGRHGSVDNRLCDTVTVEARIDGLGPGSTVTATYKPAGSASISMSPISTPISDTSAVFRATFPRHTDSPWSPTASNSETEVFRIVARTEDGRTSTVSSTNQITFVRSSKNNGNC